MIISKQLGCFYWIVLLMKTLVLVSSVNLRHQLWFTKWQEQAINPLTNPFRTKNWNYCDLKCLYLENYNNFDFVVIWFKQKAYRPPFAACYIIDQTSKYGYKIWDKKVKNQFYETTCGMDMEDYLQTPTQYQIVKIQGQGRQF